MPTIPTPTLALNCSRAERARSTRLRRAETGSVGHDAANHVRRGRFGEEQGAEAAAGSGFGDPDRQSPFAQGIEQDLRQRAVIIGVDVVAESTAHLRQGFG